MTPEEKAIELVDAFAMVDIESDLSYTQYKKLSLIAVNEILKLTPVNGKLTLMNYSYINFKYWDEVKQEIEKL